MNLLGLRAAAGLVLALQASTTLACGYCVEDKIAATYDHSVVMRALGAKHHVAFFHIDGPLGSASSARQVLASSVASVAGVDSGSVRVSVETATISVAFDPRRTSLAKLLGAMEKRLLSSRLSLLPLRVMDRPAELNRVSR